MMKKFLRFFTVIILFLNFSSAQELFFKQKPLLFFEEKSKQIIVIENDSLIIKINEKVKIPLKYVDYPKNLRDWGCNFCI
jgi:hypothetical protein